jgi:Bacterial SH3 domain
MTALHHSPSLNLEVQRHVFISEPRAESNPDDLEGFRLLVYEVMHVKQQAQGLVSPGFDSSSGLENDAKLEGQKAVGNRSNLEKQVNNFNDYLLKPNLENQPIISPRASQRFRATHATARAIQRQADQDTKETPIAKTAFVREEGLHLREKPDQQSKDLGTFTFGTRVFVIAQTGQWYKVLTASGKSGYMFAAQIHGLQPKPQNLLQTDPGLRLFRVKQGESGWALVKRAYGIQGNESTKDQGIYHFLNAIRAVNEASMFKIVMQGNGLQQATGKAKNWVGDQFGSGLDANDVQLQQGDLWIPSFAFAAKMNVGSGTMGGEVTRLGKNIEQKVKDFQAAQTYAKAAIGPIFAKRLEQGAHELIEGLITTLIAAAGLLVATTAIGAIIGAFAGGVGAAPGAALGFEIGMWLLQWLGLGFLVAWGVGKLAQVFGALGTFVSKVWNANGDQKQLQVAGVALADSLAILAVTALQILVTIGIAKGLGAATRGLANSKFGKAIGIPKLTAYLKGKLARVDKTAGSTPTTARLQQGLRETTPRAVAGNIKNPLKPLKPNSVVIDSNAAIALQKQAAGLPLQAGELAIIKRLEAMGNADLRVAGTTVAEVRGGQIKFTGFPLEIARSSVAYQNLLKVLEKFNVGQTKGIADRMIVADTFFAKVEPGAKATFATMDSRIYNRLYEISGGDARLLGKPVSEAFPNGFNVTINGRTIRVIPLPKK